MFIQLLKVTIRGSAGFIIQNGFFGGKNPIMHGLPGQFVDQKTELRFPHNDGF